MMLPDWPSGHRHVHHGFDAERAQREQALIYRDHHEEDHHTRDGHYAAVDEAFTRLSALERPSTERRLAILRKKAAARVIQRQYNREANWLVHHDQHLYYGHFLMLHGRYPDRHDHPSLDGLALSDEDKQRIGPTREDLWTECWNRVADFAPAMAQPDDVPPWLVPIYISARRNGHVLARMTSAQIVDYAEQQRARARLLAAMPDQPDAEVRDNYFEPELWAAAHTSDLRDYVRLALLGDGNPRDQMARDALALSSADDDFIAFRALLVEAQRADEFYPVWENPPTTLPATVNVSVSGKAVNVSWSGALPAGTQVVASVAVAGDLAYKEHQTVKGSSNFSVTLKQTGRGAVLVQFERTANVNQTDARTTGSVAWVGAIR